MSCCGGASGNNSGNNVSTKTSRAIASLKETGAEFNKKNLFETSVNAASIDANALPKLILNQEQLTALYTSSESNFSLVLPGKNQEVYTLLLNEVFLYGPEFSVVDGNGNVVSVPKGRHYFGVVEGRLNTQVVLDVYPDQVSGSIMIDNDCVEIVRETVEVSDLYQIRLASSQLRKPLSCTTDTSLIVRKNLEDQISAQTVSNNCSRIYFDVDNSITNFFAGDVPNTTAYVTSLFANIASTYLNDEDVQVVLFLQGMTVYTNASPPPFTNGPTPGDALTGITGSTGYSEYRTANPVAGAGVYNFINSDMGGGNGVAWSGTNCQPFAGPPQWAGPFAVSGTSNTDLLLSTSTIAHEMGHVYGSNHTFDCVWNSPLGANQSLGGCGIGAEPCGNLCSGSNPQGSCVQPGADGYPFVGASGSTGLSGQTIMGYCNPITPLVFGPQPGAVVRNSFNGCTACIVCLDATTMILLADGTSKPICELKRGDYVAGDLENTKSYRISKVNIASYFPDQEMATVVFAPGSLGENMPISELRMTEGHPIFYNGCRRSARCFKNFPGVTFSQDSECQDVFQVSKEGMVYVYDLQFDDDGSYVANGTMVQSRCPWSIVTPLEKHLYFNPKMYREERATDSLNHTVPRDWAILESFHSTVATHF